MQFCKQRSLTFLLHIFLLEALLITGVCANAAPAEQVPFSSAQSSGGVWSMEDPEDKPSAITSTTTTTTSSTTTTTRPTTTKTTTTTTTWATTTTTTTTSTTTTSSTTSTTLPPCYTQEDIDQAVSDALQQWDVGGDGKKGLAEAIDALQTLVNP